jgi:YgiT-type zinc finger domain-containing protein
MEKRFPESPVILCLICRQAELTGGFTSLIFARDEQKLTLNHVPAIVCPKCGEAIVQEYIAEQLLVDAEEIFETGIGDLNQDFASK